MAPQCPKLSSRTGVRFGSDCCPSFIVRKSAAVGGACVKTPALRLHVENLLDFVSLKNKNIDDRYGGKTIEKTMLRVLRSCMFSHSLGGKRPSAWCKIKTFVSPVS